MDELQRLIQERDALNDRISQLQMQTKTKAIDEIRSMAKRVGLSHSDLIRIAQGASTPEKAMRPAKYIDPQTGAAWSGMGKKPNWFKAAIAKGVSASSMLA